MTANLAATQTAVHHRNGNGYHEAEPEDFDIDDATLAEWAAATPPSNDPGDVDAVMMQWAADGFPMPKQFDAAAFKRKVDPMPDDDTGAKEVDARAGPRFKPMSLADLLAQPPKQWMIDQVIGRGDLAMIYGAPGSGKTFLAVDLVFAACLGRSWGDRFTIAQPMRVAYMAGEGFSGLRDRFDAARQHYGVDTLDNFLYFDAVPQLAKQRYERNEEAPDIWEDAKHFVREWHREERGAIDLLIIDTLHAASLGAEENSATDTAWLIAHLKHIAKELDCAVMVIHHTNKGGTAERGSSALRGAMDCMIQVETAETATAPRRQVTCAKLKDADAWKAQTFDLIALNNSVYVSWNAPGVGIDDDEEKETDERDLLKLLEKYPSQQFTVSMLIDATGHSKGYVHKLIGRLVKRGDVVRSLAKPGDAVSKNNPWLFQLAGEVTTDDAAAVLAQYGI